MIISGMVIGGCWVTIAGALRQYRGVNETISSLLLNYIARALLNHCVEGPMRDVTNLNVPSSWPLDPSVMLGNIPGTEMHVGLIFGIVACVMAWILMDHTIHGFATRVVGGNVRAAKVAGLSVAKYSLMACFLGGAAAGLAGVVEVAARDGAATDNLSQAGYGYAGILVAFVARQNPLAIIPVAILLGGVNNDYFKMKLDSDSCVQVFQGILFLVILGLDTWAGRLSELRHAWFLRLLCAIYLQRQASQGRCIGGCTCQRLAKDWDIGACRWRFSPAPSATARPSSSSASVKPSPNAAAESISGRKERW